MLLGPRTIELMPSTTPAISSMAHVQIILMQTSTPALQRDFENAFHCWDDRFANVERLSASHEIILIDTNRFTVRAVKSTKLA
jgi:hypothetical protein